jgi:hypothetical protein
MRIKAIIDKNSGFIIALAEDPKINGNYITGTKFYTRNLEPSPNMLICKDNVIIKDLEILKIDDNIEELRQKVILIMYSDDIAIFVDCKNKEISKEIKELLDLIEHKIVNYNSKLGITKKIEINKEQLAKTQNEYNIESTSIYR